MTPYKPLNSSMLDQPNDQWLFESVSDHLNELLGEQWHPITNIEMLPGVPNSAKHVWYAWWFAAEVGGSGIFSYIVNLSISASEVKHTLDALCAIGARDLAARLQSAIVLSHSVEGAELWHDENAEAVFEGFALAPDYQDFAAVDENIFEVIATPFSTIAAVYIREQSLYSNPSENET